MNTLCPKYNTIATGERCPLKNLSETQPESSEPATAASGMPHPSVQNTARGFAFMSIFNCCSKYNTES